MKTPQNKQRYAPSKRISVRFHEHEVVLLDKNRKKVKRSDYIRSKTLS